MSAAAILILIGIYFLATWWGMKKSPSSKNK